MEEDWEKDEEMNGRKYRKNEKKSDGRIHRKGKQKPPYLKH